MYIFDTLYYTIFSFFTKKLRRSKEDATESSLWLLLLYITLEIQILASIIGLLRNNTISLWIVNNFLITSFIALVIGNIFLRIRYYKAMEDFESFRESLFDKSVKKEKILTYFSYFTLIIVPIFFYILYRVYLFEVL